jgi:hypothetical protein
VWKGSLLRSSRAAVLVAALMAGVCRALCLYIRPIPYLQPPCPNACWVGGDGLTSCTPLCLEGQLAPGCASRASVPSVPGFSSTSPILDHWTTILTSAEVIIRRWSGEANDENLLDRSSLRHLDSPPHRQLRHMARRAFGRQSSPCRATR